MKISFFSFWILITSLTSHAQNNWLRSAGGQNHDEAFDMAATSDGNFAIVGYFGGGASFGSVNLSSSGFSDAFVQKIDLAGNSVWAKKFGGTKPDRAISVACDAHGNIYVTGFFTNQAVFGSFTMNSSSDSLEIFITKLNSDGVVQWVKSCGGTSNDYSYGIAVDQDDNVIVTGQFRGVAQFGNYNLTSDMYENNSYWSNDVFVTKLDTNGEFLWAKKGSAQGDDRGLSVTTDNLDNIYVCGQFSDTITFDQVHNNQVANAGFLIKYSPDGVEQWFNRLAASQLVAYDVTTDNDYNILLTGEYSGQMAIFNTTVDIVPASHAFNIFLSKFSQNGHITWTSHAGSNNFCSAKAVCVGASNEAYVTGTFNCVMTEFSEAYGSGIFNSVGYRDVFVTRINTDGTRIWERQFASAKDDYCAAIAYGDIADKPLIAGSYESYFNVPSSTGFELNSQNEIDYWLYQYPNCGGTFCADTSYSYFAQVKAEGGKDIFLSSPVNTLRLPYDYYKREVGAFCDRPALDPCVNITSQSCSDFNLCPDSVLMCNPSLLLINTYTGSSGFVGPAYNYLWSNGSPGNQIIANNSGWYWAQTMREDGCKVFIDSIYVTVAPPLCPTIMDDAGFNSSATCLPATISLCSPESVLLTGSGYSGTQFWWFESSQGIMDSRAGINVNTTGSYYFNFIDSYNCQRSSSVDVNVIQSIDTIVPQLIIELQPAVDTIHLQMCENAIQCIQLSLIDLFPNLSGLFDLNVQVDWTIYQNGIIVVQAVDYTTSFCFHPPGIGLFQVVATPTIIPPWPCEGEIPYPPVVGWLTYQILEAPLVNLSITGEVFICPGDTTLITGSGANQLNFSGEHPFTFVGDSAILIDVFGQYSLHGISILNGCIREDWLNFEVLTKPAPNTWMVPTSGIVCPGDSVQLWCEEGQAYHWIGPLGNEIDSTQSIYVNSPGFYYCILTDYSGCILESNMVEVKEYSTPYLIANPGSDLCVNGSVLVQIATGNSEGIMWGAPFNDSAIEHWIFDQGVYNVSVTGCGITTALNITITHSVTEAIITPSSNVFCPNDSIALTANGGMQSYLWQPGNIPFETINITTPGIYYLTTTDALGCTGTTSYQVMEYDIESPFTDVVSICTGESATLNVSSANTIFWTTDVEGLNIVASGNTFTTPSLSQETIYYVFAQDDVCVSYPSESLVEIYLSSIPPIFGGDEAICLGADAVLITPMQAGMSYQWTLPDGTTSTADSIFIFNATEYDEGIYYLAVADANCSAMDSLSFTVVPQGILQLDDNNKIEVCVGNAITITSPVEADQYIWSTPLGIVNGSQTLVINPASEINTGIYTLTLSNAVCEFEVLPLTVEVNAYPNITLDPCVYYCSGGYMTLGFQENYDWYLWSTGDTSATIIAPDSGWFSVQVANNPDCMVQTTVYVPTTECIEGFINIMTCNGDGLNEFADFGVLRAKIDAVHIYDRWGVVVETLAPSNLKWDGKGRSGEKVSSGVYYYVIDYAPIQHRDCNCYLPKNGYIQVFSEK